MAIPYRRGNVWWARLRWPEHEKADQEGKVRLPLHSNRRLAESMLADLIKQRENVQRRVEVVDPSWSGFKARYEKYLLKMAYDTRMAHNRALREVETFLAPREVSQITPGVLEDLHVRLIEKELGRYMVVKIIKSVKAIMRKAELWRVVPPQDWREVRTGKLPRGRTAFFTHDQMEALNNKLTGLWLTGLRLGAEAGLRPGEIYHQRVDTVSFTTKKIIVQAVKCDECSVTVHRPGEWVPKTAGAVDLKDGLARYLRAWIGQIRGPWLIMEPSGWRPTYDGFVMKLGDKIKEARIKGSAYTLRHTYGTHEIQRGEDIRRVRDNMRHNSITTTEIYLHLPLA